MTWQPGWNGYNSGQSLQSAGWSSSQKPRLVRHIPESQHQHQHHGHISLIQRLDGHLLTPGPSLTQRLENAFKAADPQRPKSTMIMINKGPEVHPINLRVKISLQKRNTVQDRSMTIDATTNNEHKFISIILKIIIEAASIIIEKIII